MQLRIPIAARTLDRDMPVPSAIDVPRLRAAGSSIENPNTPRGGHPARRPTPEFGRTRSVFERWRISPDGNKDGSKAMDHRAGSSRTGRTTLTQRARRRTRCLETQRSGEHRAEPLARGQRSLPAQAAENAITRVFADLEAHDLRVQPASPPAAHSRSPASVIRCRFVCRARSAFACAPFGPPLLDTPCSIQGTRPYIACIA